MPKIDETVYREALASIWSQPAFPIKIHEAVLAAANGPLPIPVCILGHLQNESVSPDHQTLQIIGSDDALEEQLSLAQSILARVESGKPEPDNDAITTIVTRGSSGCVHFGSFQNNYEEAQNQQLNNDQYQNVQTMAVPPTMSNTLMIDTTNR